MVSVYSGIITWSDIKSNLRIGLHNHVKINARQPKPIAQKNANGKPNKITSMLYIKSLVVLNIVASALLTGGIARVVV